LQPTERRLGEAAASTNRYAAHGTFKSALPLLRASAAVAPNRMLSAAHLSDNMSFSGCRTRCATDYIIPIFNNMVLWLFPTTFYENTLQFLMLSF